MSILSERNLFTLIRLAFGAGKDESANFNVETAEEWSLLYSLASKLSVVGIAYAGVCKLPKDRRPPLDLAFQWASEAEAIRGHNRMVNDEAKRLTELFADQGRRSAILKGAANARLYPDAFIRQAGDIDIWVEGGREGVVALLQKLGMMITEPSGSFFFSRGKSREELYALAREKLSLSGHHVHLLQKCNGVNVEVHFKPSSGNLNPFTNRALQNYLAREIESVELVPEGFYVPSLKFALAMQLSHIQRHLLSSGIGLKQLTDYYVLLLRANDSDRLEMSKNLRRFGLLRTAKALMWVLGHIYALDRAYMLCAPDKGLGKQMLAKVIAGGNFGFYYGANYRNFVTRWFGRRWRAMRFCPFSPVEMFWGEIAYWRNFFRSIPIRIKLRKLSIRDLF
ncbi:MAG: nucleotidyltransferase family protein [Fibrobacter sp.]|nr:nucleotidyltransferase family protein [Fibrobacter sp.]